ncbi:l-galactose dehydrogenase [Phlyctema vagabunda]|uniref:L-galactose dehydrogenase n=1 Tax=Phlyctema vagabunda TaxID=108571 RepID=A0ABR4PC90_9HELO
MSKFEGSQLKQLLDRPSLSSKASKIVLGGGSFTHQSHPNPETLPVRQIIQRALDSGIRTFDTSPYYGPSEELLGDAFSQPGVLANYQRNEYVLMTKVGRIKALEFDYSPAWVRKSIERSLSRLGTKYLDVVFCHDIEYVTTKAAVTAVGVLFELVLEGKIKYVGVSGYAIEQLIEVAKAARSTYGIPLDTVQCWGQLTLQNSRMEEEGFPGLHKAGVDTLFCSSPLVIGLLRSQGVPIGTLGDWHPAPPGLRQAVRTASLWAEEQGHNLAGIALRYSTWKCFDQSDKTSGYNLIIASNSVEELDSNIQSISSILRSTDHEDRKYDDVRDLAVLDTEKIAVFLPLFEHIRKMLGSWVNYSFQSPDEGWDTQSQTMQSDKKVD